MSWPSLHELQTAILDAVAPEGWRDMGITFAKLELTAQRLPRLTLDIAPRAFNGGGLRKMFELRPIDTPAPAPESPPLDLDKMAADAMRRITQRVESLAIRASVVTSYKFKVAANASAQRCHEQLRRHRLALSQWHMRQRVRPCLRDLAADQEAEHLSHARRRAAASAANFRDLINSMPATMPRKHEPGMFVWSVLGALAFAMVLGALGPALDAQPDRRAEWLQAEQELQQQGTLARWEAQARERCTRLGSDNSGYLPLDGGGIVCTDKRGQVLAQGGRP